MRSISAQLVKRPLPLGAIIVIIMLALLLPLYEWTTIGWRDWGYGGSAAARLDAPYFWGILIFRTLGAILLAGLLAFSRSPTAIWITIIASWLAGPPITFLWTGIDILAGSLAKNSVPHHWGALVPSCAFSMFVTLCLVVPKKVREAYCVQMVASINHQSGS